MILTELYTGADGVARFRDLRVPLAEGSPAARLSALIASGGCQFRQSPVGFASDFHCTTTPQWLVVLRGQMEIGLQDGSARVFGPGQCFYSNDTLPPGATFDPRLHGHRSRQLGDVPLATLFVRC
ncbi:MAG: hypothetical protein Q4G70_04420 [Pseudomonadota bacterium]|nr:hypothetical protein [Pseudomonadota bacterium]